MKKTLSKIFASASVVVAIVLIMILLVTTFGGIGLEEFDNNLVKGLIVTLAAIYGLLAISALILMFINSDVVKEIMVRSEQQGSVRATIAVIRKMVKKSCEEIEGVKCKKVTIITNEYGVRLKVNVKVIDKDVVEVETYIRTLLEDVFKNVLGFRFHAIEIKVISLKSKYQADQEIIEDKVQDKLALMAEEQKTKDELEALKEAEKAQQVAEERDKVRQQTEEFEANKPAESEKVEDNSEIEKAESEEVSADDVSEDTKEEFTEKSEKEEKNNEIASDSNIAE